jgi:hypothetical protein
LWKQSCIAMEKVSASVLFDRATQAGSRLPYGVFYALRSATEANVEALRDQRGRVLFTKWISNKQADFILPKLDGFERIYGGYQISGYVKNEPITVTYYTGMCNGNVRIDIEWVDMLAADAYEKKMQEEKTQKEQKNKLFREVLSYACKCIRNGNTEDEIKGKISEIYGSEVYDQLSQHNQF